MKTIVSINLLLPTLINYQYTSGHSLQDFEIVIFNPELPYYSRESFSDGTSAINRSSGNQLISNIKHWRNEITNALKDGKTIFMLVAKQEIENYITGLAPSTSKNRTYQTSTVSNYDILPVTINLNNSKGEKIKLLDNRFTTIFETLKDYLQYEAYLTNEVKSPIATTNSGKIISFIQQLDGYNGHLVFLPYFDIEWMIETDKKGDQSWPKSAMGLGTNIIKNLLEFDKVLTEESKETPKPAWIDLIPKSNKITGIQKEIDLIDRAIQENIKSKNEKETELKKSIHPIALLYETGKSLEVAVTEVLKMLGYEVSSYRKDALEIDHILISPDGKRLIGEAEGKDNSAIGMDKFRQLETNINEDFQQDEITEPAQGILFGNGYRLKDPSIRDCQFTEKCLINAKRLKTVLVQTSDLFPIAMYLQDNPTDEDFKKTCRIVIESQNGEITIFPPVPSSSV